MSELKPPGPGTGVDEPVTESVGVADSDGVEDGVFESEGVVEGVPDREGVVEGVVDGEGVADGVAVSEGDELTDVLGVLDADAPGLSEGVGEALDELV